VYYPRRGEEGRFSRYLSLKKILESRLLVILDFNSHPPVSFVVAMPKKALTKDSFAVA
jgi:hypothetical protein